MDSGKSASRLIGPRGIGSSMLGFPHRGFDLVGYSPIGLKIIQEARMIFDAIKSQIGLSHLFRARHD